MKEVSIVGLDLAKRVFQAHGASADGGVVFRRKLSRAQVLAFVAWHLMMRLSSQQSHMFRAVPILRTGS